MLKNEEQIITKSIPFFPLGIIVLPGETRFLHVFESRYKNLFNDIQKFGNYFGIPYFSRGNINDVGSLVKLEKIMARFPGGELDVAVKGIDIFSVTKLEPEHPQRLYPFGDIFLLNRFSVKISTQLLTLFEEYSEKVLEIDLNKYPKLSFYVIANSIGLTDQEKYELIIQKDEKAMNKILTYHLRLRNIIACQHNSLSEFYSLN